MKKFYFLFVIALVAMMVSCKKEAEQTEEAAQPQTTEEKEAMAEPSSEALSIMSLGQQLALYGYENEAAEALIEAADILSNITSEQLPEAAEKGEAEGEQAEKTTPERSFVPADLLAKAKELAGTDATLLAMIKKVEDKIAAGAEGQRGSTITGSKVATTRVQAHSYDSYTVEFRAGEIAECAIVGDGDTDLDLYIYDENGNLITSDTDYTDRCYCRWTPRWQGNFRLKVVNRGNVYNQYTIAVN